MSKATLTTNRLESFSDGVIAVIITIMVLALHPPANGDAKALLIVAPSFSAYVLSFVFIAIYWNNHHFLLRQAKTVTPGIMWANITLLFFLSIIPFSTAWLGSHINQATPTALYSILALCSAISYSILQHIIMHHAKDETLHETFSNDMKGRASIGLYTLAVIFSILMPFISYILLVLVSIIWFIPDRRLRNVT